MRKSTTLNIMKRLLLLLILCTSLYSCTGEPLPSNINLNDTNHDYLILWRSNQGNPSMSITVLHQGQYIHLATNVTDNQYKVTLNDSDMVIIGITYKEAKVKPEIYLAIYQYREMNLQSGIYEPGAMDLLYEQEVEANAFGYNESVKTIKSQK